MTMSLFNFCIVNKIDSSLDRNLHNKGLLSKL